jgi:hypothetical protein
MFAASKTASVSGGYQISRSLRFSQPDSSYLSRTPASAGSRTTWTLSGWFKGFKSNLNNVIYVAGSGANQTGIYIDSGNQQLNFYEIQSSSTIGNLVTTQVFRDYSAWYHIVATYDSTQATASSRMRLYVNGSQVTAFGTATYVSQNTNSIANSAVITEFGNGSGNAAFYDGYMTEIYFVDGQALTPSSFGETNAQTGVWQPKAYSGAYGTNGFYLNFSDNSNTTAATLGKDYSGNGNNWTPNNFSVTAGAGNDSLVDSPTSYGTDTGVGGTVRGNYATLNPLILGTTTTLANGNLDYSKTNTLAPAASFSTIGITSGKWYAEYTVASNFFFGIWGNGNSSLLTTAYPTYYWDVGASSGALTLEKSSGTSSGSGGTFAAGDIYAIAFDADAATFNFYKNNSLIFSVTGMVFLGPLFFTVGAWGGGVTSGPNSINFGQRPFAYTAPSGFKALCTQNLPTPTIGATSATTANKYFDAVTYSGSASSQTVVNSGAFQPDLVWAKSRSNALNNILVDSIRGGSLFLVSNSIAADATSSGLATFVSNGITWVGGASGVNDTGITYVDWMWKGGGTGVTNTSGSITSTVSANTTSGFSVVTYTGNSTAGATVGHGLGVVPAMVIYRLRNATSNWIIYHQSLAPAVSTALQFTTAAAYTTTAFNNTAPTSTLLTIGGASVGTNDTGYNFVAYCFAEVAGYSKFGSYTGNGSTDGPFVFTGFRPAFIMYKRSSTAGNSWRITDSTRSTYNVDNAAFLYPDTNETENFNANDALDILSNGFKIRTTSAPSNTSGDTYIYMAFASNPFKTSLAR